MLAIILVLYAIFILSAALVSFFIVYHLVKYSINPHFSHLLVLVFTIVSAILLLSNLILFFSVDWNMIITNLIPNNFKAF
ncbi:MAG: hypothetical protein NTY33_02610 [Candidatus Moranbacteria bacterium]|nr:hypothetical protein [Candidatus Moranbacteria bacterium]